MTRPGRCLVQCCRQQTRTPGFDTLGRPPMRFMIHGADQKTGREMTVVMEAPDESEAERRALYNDILVSSVARFTAGAAAGGAAEREARRVLAEVTAPGPAAVPVVATSTLAYQP